MGTRSRIGIGSNDGSILSAYHHWDGYPTWLGKVLTKEYNTKEKVANLIDGGDMSCCWSDSIWGKQLPKGEYAPEYYSARGEDCPLVTTRIWKSSSLMVKNTLTFSVMVTGLLMICTSSMIW